mgnify:CR=1 FL=1
MKCCGDGRPQCLVGGAEPINVANRFEPMAGGRDAVRLFGRRGKGAQQVGHRGVGGNVVVCCVQNGDRGAYLGVEISVGLVTHGICGVATGRTPLAPLKPDLGW